MTQRSYGRKILPSASGQGRIPDSAAGGKRIAALPAISCVRAHAKNNFFIVLMLTFIYVYVRMNLLEMYGKNNRYIFECLVPKGSKVSTVTPQVTTIGFRQLKKELQSGHGKQTGLFLSFLYVIAGAKAGGSHKQSIFGG